MLLVLVVATVVGMAMRTCEWCGGEFVANSIGRAAIYCGRSCRELAYRERRTRRRIAEAVAAARSSDSSVDESRVRRRQLPAPESGTLF